MTLNRRGAFLPATNEGVHADSRGRLVTAEQSHVRPPSPGHWCLTANVGTTAGEAEPWRPWDGAVFLDFVTLTASDVGSDATITITGNGSTTTITLPSTETMAQVAVNGLRWTPADRVIVETDGGRALTVQLWMQGNGGGGLVVPAAGSGGGLPPVMWITGSESVTDGADVGVVADKWYSSPGMDAFVDVTSYSGKHAIAGLQDCDLQVTLTWLWGYSNLHSEYWAHLELTDVVDFFNSDVEAGPTLFHIPGTQVSPNTDSTSHSSSGSVTALLKCSNTTLVKPKFSQFNASASTRTVYWQASVELCETTVDRTADL